MKKLAFIALGVILGLIVGTALIAKYAEAATPPATVPQGGTGWGAIQAGGIVYGGTTLRIATTSQGTAGQILAWLNGIPKFTATTTFSSGLTYLNGNVTNTGVLSITATSPLSRDTATGAVTISCPTCSTGGAFPFSPDNNFNQVVYSTSTPTLWFKSGVFASSTSAFDNSTTTLATVNTKLWLPYITSPQVLYLGNDKSVLGAATSSLTASGVLSLSQPISVIGGSASALTVTGGTNGQVLGWLAGVPTWTASSSVAVNSPLTLTTSGAVSTLSCGTCNTSAASVTSVGLTSSDSSLTISNTPVTTSGTLGAVLNLAHGNTWTAAQLFYGTASSTDFAATRAYFGGTATTSVGVNGYLGVATTTPYGKLSINPIAGDGSAPSFVIGSSTATMFKIDNAGQVVSTNNKTGHTGVLSPDIYASFSYATSTVWTGTTTVTLGVATVPETWQSAVCYTDTGTVNVQFYNITAKMNMIAASTATSSTNFSTNNTLTTVGGATTRKVDIGTPASSPTVITCTVDRTLTAQ